MCILFSILQATLLFKPRRRQETTSAKNVRTLLQKESFQNGTKNCCGIGIYQTRISNFKTVIFFSHPSSQSKVDANVFENQKLSWACVQDVSSKTAEKKRRNTAKFNLFNICIDLFKNFLALELYLQCRETARYQENLPPASLSMLG